MPPACKRFLLISPYYLAHKTGGCRYFTSWLGWGKRKLLGHPLQRSYTATKNSATFNLASITQGGGQSVLIWLQKWTLISRNFCPRESWGCSYKDTQNIHGLCSITHTPLDPLRHFLLCGKHSPVSCIVWLFCTADGAKSVCGKTGRRCPQDRQPRRSGI